MTHLEPTLENRNRHTLLRVGRFLISLLGLCVFTYLAYIYLERPDLGIDDAHIFFVYGQNAANNHGLVYNVGGERVEGFTSPLWLVFVTLASFVPAYLTQILLVINLLIAAGLVALVWHFLDKDKMLTWQGGLFLGWVFGSPSFVVWTTLTLMDVTLWMGVLMLGAMTVLADGWRRYFPVAIVLLILTRPEGALWAAFFLILHAIHARLTKNWQYAWHNIRWNLVIYVTTLTLLITARLIYFGYPLPNTYYAKVSPDFSYNLINGVIYLKVFLQENPIPLILSWVFLTVSLVKSLYFLRRLPSQGLSNVTAKQFLSASSLLIPLLGLLFPVITGGDHFAHARFYQPIWLIFLFPLLDQLSKQQFSKRTYRLVVLFAIPLFFISPATNWFNFRQTNGFQMEFDIARQDKQVGQYLNELFPSSPPEVGVITAGGIAFIYNGHVLDTMGLNNTTVAHLDGPRYGTKNHDAFNGTLFLTQRPDLFLPELLSSPLVNERGCHEIWGEYSVWLNSTLKGLLEEARFWDVYERVLLRRNETQIVTYVEKSYLEQLPQMGLEVEILDCY